ncbi:ATPase, T2SS/T4P/T4SS family [Desulfosporosinus shakirovi]|uniref:ATPase, T2SS/T4P/T4SS family n=1 Tax=Desulfosporosinus shakirovi TaxID=2885154 RepID=UPI001E3797D6|nr:ATPase, T2SS/T4P/T4SS family [Desulfosporosinus sp. SRJS8]MCB8818333.1 Flp pilus assembly complex ATPase component TadA [Desulfosporosinus sp. SRJS8]
MSNKEGQVSSSYKLKVKPKIDVNRIQLDVQRQREYRTHAKDEDLGIEEKANFLNLGEKLGDLLNTPIGLETIYDDILDVEKDVYNKINRNYSHLLDGNKDTLERDLPRVIANIISSQNLNFEEKRFIFNRVANSYIGYGILQPLWADKSITEIMCNAYDSIFVEVGGQKYQIGPGTTLFPDIKFADPKSYAEYVRKLYSKTGHAIDQVDCLDRAELPDVSRITANWTPVVRYPTFNIRKPTESTKRYTSKSFIETGAATEEIMELLGVATEGLCNIVILGATGTGKTTVNRILIEEHTTRDRVIEIGDTRETNPIHPHFISMQTVSRDKKRVDFDKMIAQVLSMLPDRILIQEMRAAMEAAGFLKILNHGHDGILTTGHSKNPERFVSLMVIWLKESGMNIDEHYLRKMLHDSLDVLVFTKRLRSGPRKITSVWEVLPWDGTIFGFREIFTYDFKLKKHVQCGKVSRRMYQHCFENDVLIPEKYVEESEGMKRA